MSQDAVHEMSWSVDERDGQSGKFFRARLIVNGIVLLGAWRMLRGDALNDIDFAVRTADSSHDQYVGEDPSADAIEIALRLGRPWTVEG